MRGALSLVLLCGVPLAGCDAPLSPEGEKWLRAANAAYLAGDDAKAVDCSTRVVQRHAGIQESGEAYYLRGLARCRQGDAAAGRQDLAAAVKATRREDLMALAHAKLGDLAYRAGDLPEARQQYRAALAHAAPATPPGDEALYRVGCIHQRDGRWREADACFDKLLHFFDGTRLAELAKTRVRADRWSIQAAALTTVTAASETRDRLRREGLSSRVDLELRRDRMLRLVRVGSYPSHRDALADLARVQKICPDAYLTPAR